MKEKTIQASTREHEREEPAQIDGSSPTIPSAACLQEQAVATEPGEPMRIGTSLKTITHKKTLPNCRITGIDYRVTVEKEIADIIDLKEIDNIWFKSFAEFPIHWNPEKYEISCHPNQSGEFVMCVAVDVAKRERHIFHFKLIVIPDPKTLWKNIPSKQDGVYPKPDSDTLFLACGDKLSIVAASQRGRSHAQEGKPRDDDFLAHWDAQSDCAILVVADGAGSAKFSRKGSQLAAQVALDKVKAAIDPEFWATLEHHSTKWVENQDVQAQKSMQIALYKVLVQAAWEAKARIKKEAEEFEEQVFANSKKREGFTARDYATTMILTIVKKLDRSGWFVATFWVGDGGMGVYCADGENVIVQGTPDGGEYGGQTRFLTEESAEVWPQGADAWSKITERRMRFDVVDAFDAVILMTDGVTDPKFETDNNLNLQSKWNELWAELEKEVPFNNRDESVADALLKWMDFWSPGNHDDRTMIVLY
jgi:serine/threonine protein phosphatase PrpC